VERWKGVKAAKVGGGKSEAARNRRWEVGGGKWPTLKTWQATLKTWQARVKV